MKLGVSLPSVDFAMRPDDFARACEERGFESVWYPEHTHIPASRRTPYPAGGDLPETFWHMHDLFIALSVAAAVTTTIKIGSGVCLVIERDPIILAKTVSTLDPDFSSSWQWPKPLPRPHPPIWVGGGKSTTEHAVEWGDGWMPIEGVMPVARMTRDIRVMAADVGRDPAELTIYLGGAQSDPTKIDEYREAGLDGMAWM